MLENKNQNSLVLLRNKVHALQVERFKMLNDYSKKLVDIKLLLMEKFGFSPDGAEQFIVSATNSDLAESSIDVSDLEFEKANK